MLIVSRSQGTVGMRIILDRHSAKNENYFNETLWYIPDDKYYTEQTLIKDWVMLARRYRGTTVVRNVIVTHLHSPLHAMSSNRSGWIFGTSRSILVHGVTFSILASKKCFDFEVNCLLTIIPFRFRKPQHGLESGGRAHRKCHLSSEP